MSTTDIITVLSWIIHFGNELNSRMLRLHLWNGPLPELHWHHLGHIATESINLLVGPEQQDMQHLMPRIGYWIEIPLPTALIVDTIVQLYRLVPIVLVWIGIKLIVAGSFGRVFMIRQRCIAKHIEPSMQLGVGNVIEIVGRTESTFGIVCLAQLLHTCWLLVAMILSSHMVGHKVHDKLQPCLMGTFHQRFKLTHTSLYIHRQIGIHIIVVFDGIRRASLSFYHSRMVRLYAVARIIGLCGMLNKASKPYMCST